MKLRCATRRGSAQASAGRRRPSDAPQPRHARGGRLTAAAVRASGDCANAALLGLEAKSILNRLTGQLRSSEVLSRSASIGAAYMRDFRDHTMVVKTSTEASRIRRTPTIIASPKCFLTIARVRASTKSTVAANCQPSDCRFTIHTHPLSERPQCLCCHRFLVFRRRSLALDRCRRPSCLPSQRHTPRWPSTLRHPRSLVLLHQK
jgi:hypothetical protein